MSARLRRTVLPLLVFAGLLLVWETAVPLLRIQQIVLPTPSGVALTMARTAGPIAFPRMRGPALNVLPQQA